MILATVYHDSSQFDIWKQRKSSITAVSHDVSTVSVRFIYKSTTIHDGMLQTLMIREGRTMNASEALRFDTVLVRFKAVAPQAYSWAVTLYLG